MAQPIITEEVVEAIRWKLGLGEVSNSTRASAIWQAISRSPQGESILEAICRVLSHGSLQRSLEVQLIQDNWRMNRDELRAMQSMFEHFRHWVNDGGSYRSEWVAQKVRDVLREQEMSRAAPPAIPAKTVERSPTAKVIHTRSAGGRAAAAQHTVPTRAPSPRPVVEQPVSNSSEEPAAREVPGLTPVPRAKSQWLYLPLPSADEEPDPHTEFDWRSGASSEGFPIHGARARGKKHKHDGTHCDDWFDFRTCAPWTILAVSDGGGSYKFSRVGAKAACAGAINVLADRLQNHEVRHRADWSTVNPAEPDLAHVTESLVAALTEAWQSVQDAVEKRRSDPTYEKILRRPLTTKDLYCTLLIAVHTTIRAGDEDQSLVFGCAVGDGMMAAIGQDGRARLLMVPDSGEQSGEVRFLDHREIEPAKLASKIKIARCPLQALLLMTDGVADDYFPNEPGMGWLYGDLVINNILPTPQLDERELAAALSNAQLPSAAELKETSCQQEVEVATPEGMESRTVCSVTLAAERLAARGIVVTADQLVKSPAALAALARPEIRPEATPAERLCKWIDSYHVRGSFDDRTLVVMHKQP